MNYTPILGMDGLPRDKLVKRIRKTQKQIADEIYDQAYADGMEGLIIEAPRAIRGSAKKMRVWAMGYADGLADHGYEYDVDATLDRFNHAQSYDNKLAYDYDYRFSQPSPPLSTIEQPRREYLNRRLVVR